MISGNLRKIQKLTNPISIDMPEGTYAAYKKDFQSGRITVGNVCSADCFFCSQKWNPAGVIKDLKRFLTMEEVKHFTNLYLGRVTLIGGAFHTNSGEFFLHPDAAEILELLAAKNKLPSNTQIFTNGMDLTLEHIKVIKKLKLNLCLSLNTASITAREKIMGSGYGKHKNAVDSIYALDKYDVNYRVWIVPLRKSINNGDLASTIRYLKKSKVKLISLHSPGYTKYTPSVIAKELAITDKELFDFILLMKQKYNVNVDFDRYSLAAKFKNIFQMLYNLSKNGKHLNKKSKLFLCSETAKDILPLVLMKKGFHNYKIKVVKSKVFGGNIDCAGLLLVKDYISAVKEFLRIKQNGKPDVIILPSVSFDINGEDLSMTPVREIEDRCKIKLILA